MSGKPEAPLMSTTGSPLMTQIITIDGQYVTLDPNDSAILSADEVRAVLKFIQGFKNATTEAQKKLVKQEKRLSFLEMAFPKSEQMLNEFIEKTRDAEGMVTRLRKGIDLWISICRNHHEEKVKQERRAESAEAEVRRLKADNADLKTALQMATTPNLRLATGEEIHIGFVSQSGERMNTNA